MILFIVTFQIASNQKLLFMVLDKVLWARSDSSLSVIIVNKNCLIAIVC